MDLQDDGIDAGRLKESRTLFTYFAYLISALGFAPVLSVPAFSIIILSGGYSYSIMTKLSIGKGLMIQT